MEIGSKEKGWNLRCKAGYGVLARGRRVGFYGEGGQVLYKDSRGRVE